MVIFQKLFSQCNRADSIRIWDLLTDKMFYKNYVLIQNSSHNVLRSICIINLFFITLANKFPWRRKLNFPQITESAKSVHIAIMDRKKNIHSLSTNTRKPPPHTSFLSAQHQKRIALRSRHIRWGRVKFDLRHGRVSLLSLRLRRATRSSRRNDDCRAVTRSPWKIHEQEREKERRRD